MIQIFVNGTPLTLYSDTTLNIELNNALFAEDSIEGDIVYSFEMPADSNNTKALGFENIPLVRGKKTHQCLVTKGKTQILKGTLLIQKSGKERITAAIACNNYPEGFAKRSVNKNQCEPTKVSAGIREHRENWEKFMKRCMEEDGDIKFAPFVNEEAYGQENEDFGFREGFNKGKIVNRIKESDGQTVMAFNEEIDLVEKDGLHVEKNQECLCPQIRLTAILRNIAENAGYNLTDNINGELSKVFIQGVRLLDGDITQYGELNTVSGAWKSEKGSMACRILTDLDWDGAWTGTQRERYIMNMDQNEEATEEPTLAAPGRYHFKIEWGIAGMASPMNEETFLLVYRDNTDSPENILIRYPLGAPSEEWRGMSRNGRPILQTKYIGRVYVPPTFTNTRLNFAVKQLVKDGRTGNMRYGSNLRGYMQASIEGPVRCTIQNALNIYSREFRTNELLPNVTNSEFIRKTITSLGLNWFTDARSKRIEVSAMRDIMNAKAIDISEKTLKNETTENRTERKKVKLRVAQVQEFDKDKERYMGEAEAGELDSRPTFGHKNEVWLYKPANGYVKAEEEEDADESWKCSWKLKGGNGETLETGEGETEEVRTEFKAPANTTALEYATLEWSNLSEEHKAYGLPNIPLKMASPMSEEQEDNPSDIIMLYHRGKSDRNPAQGGLKAAGEAFEMMHAAYPGQFSLMAKGDNSLGEKYMKEYVKARKANDRMTYKLYAETVEMLEIIETLKPHEVKPQNQIRFIYADGVKSLPQKIRIELVSGQEKALMEIEAVKMH
ncbi:MAG: hypothetical protein IKN99_07305 [Bacteroidales bacterium]|nr:hypothetical protein [Bacteroidales bacterium]